MSNPTRPPNPPVPATPAEDVRIPCFACERIHGISHFVLVDGEATTVCVGPSCYAKVRKFDKIGGYQPPKGGPKLFLIGSKG